MLFDTNLLMIAFEEPVDVVKRVEELLEAKIEPVILTAQLQELERIASSERRWKASRIARAVLDYVKTKFKVIESCELRVDDAIVKVAEKEGCIVATNDRELRRRLRSIGVTVIYMKSDGRFELEGCQP
ncbi:MAG: hypothetical protein QXL22_00775 [Candidatus Nezhaarchaeales archaeon]|nr:hypothetical protein [Candidatus Nezhaarchaeota archaeon]